MPELKPETRFLVQYLRDIPVGEIAYYPDLNEVAKVRDIQGKDRGCLKSALKIVQSEYGRIFQCLTNVGYKCLEQKDVAQIITGKRITRISNQTKLWRGAIVDSGEAATMSGIQSLNKCAFVEFAIDNRTQQKIETFGKQPIDLKEAQVQSFAKFFGAG